jgi:hypothetical protein|tara:strand:+ start:3499 stop:4230 length:732 start_codon:yes stop_codon:yes gene_type:complete
MNFFCISNYNNDLDWVKNYPNPHLIYDKTWNGGVVDNDNSSFLPPSNLKDRYPDYNITNGSPNGYNISDYMTFIIDHYDNLPDVTVFIKGNTVGRHVSQEVFDRLVNLQCFTPIEDWEIHDLDQDALKVGYAMLSCAGGWMEFNDSWYLNHPKHPTKYFTNYNDFLSFCFVNPVLPKYVRFPPGGNFVVPKEYILKYDRIFYENLRTFTDHSRVSGEGQMIERALYTIWMCNFKVSENMKSLI